MIVFFLVISEDLQKIIKATMHPNPICRPDVNELLRSEKIQEILRKRNSFKRVVRILFTWFIYDFNCTIFVFFIERSSQTNSTLDIPDIRSFKIINFLDLFSPNNFVKLEIDKIKSGARK